LLLATLSINPYWVSCTPSFKPTVGAFLLLLLLLVLLLLVSLQLFASSLPSSLHLLQAVDGRQQVMMAAGLGDKCYCR
jgi:hypothetical protein